MGLKEVSFENRFKKLEVESCEVFIVERKSDKEKNLVFITSDQVLFINTDCTLSHSEIEYLDKNYIILEKVTNKTRILVEE